MDLNVVRVKRKATEEPAEALVIAIKKIKCDDGKEEVILKLAATLTHEEDIQKETGARVALIKERIERIQQRQSLKQQHSYTSISKRAKVLKQERADKRQNLFAGRRLVLSESCCNESGGGNDVSQDAGDRSDHGLFKLYDIIEEKEETKSVCHRNDSGENRIPSGISCNGIPMIRVTGPQSTAGTETFVYDYYVASGQLDEKFVENSVSVQRCEPDELVYPDEDEDAEEYYDDEDDSNDEDNWRNDYPDEDSDFEKNLDYYDDYDCQDEYIMTETLKRFNIDEDRHGPAYTAYKVKVMKDLESDSDKDY